MGVGAKIGVFGTFRAVLPSGEAAQFRTARAEQVLARLAIEPGRAMSRTRLAEEIWPNAPPESQANSLRAAVSYARKGLGSGAIHSDRAKVSLDTEVESDWQEFERLERRRRFAETSEARLESLLGLDHLLGPGFLAGLHTDWAERERDRLDDVLARARCEAARLLLELGRAQQAAQLAAQSLDAMPYSEAALDALMRALIVLGRRDEARTAFAAFSSRLHTAFGAEPGHELAGLASGTGPVTSDAECFRELFRIAIEEHPEKVLELMTSERLAWPVQRHGRDFYPLLLGLLESTDGWSDERRRLVRDVLMLALAADDVAATAEWSERLFAASSPGSRDQLVALSYRAFLATRRGDCLGAQEALGAAVEVAHGLGEEYMVTVCRANLGYAKLLAGEVQEGNQMVESELAGLRKSTTRRGRLALCQAVEHLIEAALLQSDLGAAGRWLEEWDRLRRSHDLDGSVSSGYALLGWLRAMQGDAAGRGDVAQGLAEAHRERNPMLFGRLLVFSAIVLEILGRTEGEALLPRTVGFREAMAFPLLPAEIAALSTVGLAVPKPVEPGDLFGEAMARLDPF
ncbi:MAG: winged helix-turn-helix domain-containing protein [Fimbriimonadaceae bacterium]|nr:winged helix-turn-helix domain-containing protein [Fimbriimonadaceae bacterium]